MLDRVLKAWRKSGRAVLLRREACARANRVVAARTACRACADVCPEAAVAIDADISLDDSRCTGCRLCVAACPGAAMEDGPAFRRELVELWRDAAKSGGASFACARAVLPPGATAISHRCLASFVWEEQVIALLAGAGKVTLHRGDCKACPDGAVAMPIIERHVGMARRFAVAAGLGAIGIVDAPSCARATAPVAPRDLSRRDLFTKFLSRGRDAAACAGGDLASRLAAGLAEDAEPGPSAGPWNREVLHSFMTGRSIGGAVACTGLAGRPEVATDSCTFCGICVAACPTGALALAGNGTGPAGYTLSLRAHRCTACGLCEKACREAAIRIRETMELAEWCSPEPALAASANGVRCRTCGKIVSGTEHRCTGSRGRLARPGVTPPSMAVGCGNISTGAVTAAAD